MELILFEIYIIHGLNTMTSLDSTDRSYLYLVLFSFWLFTVNFACYCLPRCFLGGA